MEVQLFWLSCCCQTVKTGLSISETPRTVSWKWHTHTKKTSHEVSDRGQRIVELVTQITFYNQARKHLKMHNTLNSEANGLQQQKTTLGSPFRFGNNRNLYLEKHLILLIIGCPVCVCPLVVVCSNAKMLRVWKKKLSNALDLYICF